MHVYFNYGYIISSYFKLEINDTTIFTFAMEMAAEPRDAMAVGSYGVETGKTSKGTLEFDRMERGSGERIVAGLRRP
jgi:hypothetical protein